MEMAFRMAMMISQLILRVQNGILRTALHVVMAAQKTGYAINQVCASTHARVFGAAQMNMGEVVVNVRD